jgi:hypothetical protein
MNVECPLCKRHSPEKSFRNQEPATDIIGVIVRGLGRGRGFAVVGRYSLLNDRSLMEVISERCQRILSLIHPSNQHYVPRTLFDQWINHAQSLEKEVTKLRSLHIESMAISEELEKDALKLRHKALEADAMEDEMEMILEKINEEVAYPFEYLDDAVDYLLELL